MLTVYRDMLSWFSSATTVSIYYCLGGLDARFDPTTSTAHDMSSMTKISMELSESRSRRATAYVQGGHSFF